MAVAAAAVGVGGLGWVGGGLRLQCNPCLLIV